MIVGLQLDDDRDLVGDVTNDRIDGDDAPNVIVSGGGALDVVTGGGGADIFVVTDTAGLPDQLRILDFDGAEDGLDIGDANVLFSRPIGADLLIYIDRDSVLLTPVSNVASVTFTDDGFNVALY